MSMEGNRGGGDAPNSPPGSAARVSPVLSSTSTVVLVAPAVAGVAGVAAAQPANDNAASSSEDGSHASKKAKTASDIEKEVRELLDEKLMGSDADKVKALDKLHDYFDWWENEATYSLKKGHRRAVMEWDGCHLVLNVLRYELNRTGGPNPQVVCAAVPFLVVWNASNDERRDAMLRFNGVEAVMKAMQAFPQHLLIQENAVKCIYNVAWATQSKYRQAVLEGDCVPLIVHALEVSPPSSTQQKFGIHLLEFLCSIDGNDHSDLLIEKGALVAAAKAYAANKTSNDPEAPAILKASRRLMNKLHG